MPLRIVLGAVIVQLISAALFFLPMPLLSAVWGVSVTAALVAALIQAAASWRLPAGSPLVLGAAASAIGWGSWLLVALTSEPGDPVINITGLLVAPGLVISLAALASRLFAPTDGLPRAFLYAALHALVYAVFMVQWLGAAFISTPPFGWFGSPIPLALLGVAVTGWQVTRAHVLPSGAVRTLMLAGGYLALVGYALVLPAAWTGVVGFLLLLAAGVLRVRRER